MKKHSETAVLQKSYRFRRHKNIPRSVRSNPASGVCFYMFQSSSSSISAPFLNLKIRDSSVVTLTSSIIFINILSEYTSGIFCMDFICSMKTSILSALAICSSMVCCLRSRTLFFAIDNILLCVFFAVFDEKTHKPLTLCVFLAIILMKTHKRRRQHE